MLYLIEGNLCGLVSNRQPEIRLYFRFALNLWNVSLTCTLDPAPNTSGT